MTSSDPFWTSRIWWISSVSIHLEKNILESVKQLCNWKNEVCSIFDFKQLTVPKNWISSQSNPFWLYGFRKEHSQIISLLRISVWPWSFSLSPFHMWSFMVALWPFMATSGSIYHFWIFDFVKYWTIMWSIKLSENSENLYWCLVEWKDTAFCVLLDAFRKIKCSMSS